MGKSGRRLWQVLIGLALGLGLAAGGLYWSVQQRAAAVFERYETRAKTLIRDLRARPLRRPDLYPPTSGEDGWATLEAALVGFEAIPQADQDEIPLINGDPEFQPDLETLEDIYRKYAPLVEQLRESQRRTGFRPKDRFEDGLGMDEPNVSRMIRAARFLADRSIHLYQSGRRAEALESLTLGFAAAQDLARSPTLLRVLVLIVSEGIQEVNFRDMLQTSEFTATELAGFARTLDRLAETRPEMSDAFRTEEALLDLTVATWGASRVSSPSSLDLGGVFENRSWRYLFSQRLAAAAALSEFEGLFQRAEALRGLSPDLRAAEMEKISKSAAESPNPLIRHLFPSMGKAFQRDAVAQLQWVLMRVSVGLAWYMTEKGTPPATLEDLVPRYLPKVPACPLTGLPLRTRDGKVWSVGKNRVDDGGKPGKNDDIDDDDGDVVWTVKRRK
jgi:hypothetical protein